MHEGRSAETAAIGQLLSCGRSLGHGKADKWPETNKKTKKNNETNIVTINTTSTIFGNEEGIRSLSKF